MCIEKELNIVSYLDRKMLYLYMTMLSLKLPGKISQIPTNSTEQFLESKQEILRYCGHSRIYCRATSLTRGYVAGLISVRSNLL